jgi:serine/threonine-protein kinase HipA
MTQLSENPGRSRLTATGGQFSLAGAQAKTALYRDDGRWGVPGGRLPTTHILKPLAGQRDGMPENEHFCLRLAERCGLAVAKTEVLSIAGKPVLCATRYDRQVNAKGQIVRLHQEDICQALSVHPRKKYENEGGPTALRILDLIASVSTSSAEDRDRFVRALAFNFIVAGTDAHAKNYSIMLYPNKARLAPFYDIGSYLPYIGKEKGVKLAMKIGGHYKLDGILPRHWQSFARDARFDKERIIAHVRDLLARIPGEGLSQLHESASDGRTTAILDQLTDALWHRARFLARSYGAEISEETMRPQ